MSLNAISWVFKQDIRPSWIKFVLVALADNADDEGNCWPCIKTISQKTSQDRKTVIKSLGTLEKQGWITDTGKRTGRTGQIKIYCLSLLTKKGNSKDVHLNSPVNGTLSETVPPVLPKSPALPIEESRPSLERVPPAGHGTIMEPSIEPSMNPQGPELFPANQKGNGHAKPKRRTRAPASFITEDFRPDIADIALAGDLGVDVEKARVEFIDYWRGAGKPMSDWNATFRNRIRQIAQYRAEREQRNTAAGSRVRDVTGATLRAIKIHQQA